MGIFIALPRSLYNVNFKANPATWFCIGLIKVNDVNWNKVTFKIEYVLSLFDGYLFAISFYWVTTGHPALF